MTPHNHIQKRGCKICGKIKQGKSFDKRDKKKYVEINKRGFIEKAKQIHGNKYDYSKVEYVNTKTKVCIICPEHGEFWMTPKHHLNSCGCYECGKKNFLNKKRFTTKQFIEKARQIHGDKYDYSKVEYINTKTNVCIICPEHGEFWQTPSAHIHLKQGCPKCNESHLERKFEQFLIENGIGYIKQCNKKYFSWLDGQSLDFYLPKYNIAIECQGRQHFSEKSFSTHDKRRDLKKQIKYDTIKYGKCKNNNVKLLYFTDNVKYALSFDIDLYNINNIFDKCDAIIWEKL